MYIVGQVLKQCVVFIERRVELLAVCTPIWINTFNFYGKDMLLDAERQRVRCTWPLMRTLSFSTRLKICVKLYILGTVLYQEYTIIQR